MPSTADFLDDLRWRGQLHQCTHEQELGAHLRSGSRKAYVGFDPTADSLTIGNLVPIIALRRWQLAGHTPVVVMGGGTGLIGDPSGKTAERQLRTTDEVDANVRSQMRIFDRILDFREAPNKPIVVNNADWLGKLSYLEALRDIGKHFSVNMMVQKESVKERLHNREQGISYTEFSYMILQAYDFAHLFEAHGVTVQMGGSDQFGNIVCGMDLIGRRHPGGQSHAYGITWPLVAKADGGKFGKTEAGAVWLTAPLGAADKSPSRTTAYAFYQFWLNAADADVVRYLKTFTFMRREEIDELLARHTPDPGKRLAQKALAAHMTELLHGPEELAKVEQTARALFAKPAAGEADADKPFVLPAALLSEAPSSTHDRKLLAGTGMSLVDLLAATGLVQSKTEARTQLAQNAVHVNGRLAAADARVSEATLLPGGIIALRRGKKTWHVTRWE